MLRFFLCCSTAPTAPHGARLWAWGSHPELRAPNLLGQHQQHLHEEPCNSQPWGFSVPETPSHTSQHHCASSVKCTLLQQKAGEGQACGGNEEMRCFPPNSIPLEFVGLPADSAFICLHLSMENERKLGSLPRLGVSHGLHPMSSSNLGAGSSQGHPDTGHCSDRGH